jgi:hypothetical protein
MWVDMGPICQSSFGGSNHFGSAGCDVEILLSSAGVDVLVVPVIQGISQPPFPLKLESGSERSEGP